MNRTARFALLTAALALVTGLVSAHPPRDGRLPTPANRIVGSWQLNVAVGPCGGPTTIQFIGFNTFHAGGTLSDANTAPPASRGPGMGVWAHTGGDTYRSRFRFARFNPATGAFLGMQDVRQQAVLSDDGNSIETTVDARVIDQAGNEVGRVCGAATGQRVPLD